MERFGLGEQNGGGKLLGESVEGNLMSGSGRGWERKMFEEKRRLEESRSSNGF